jgi:hypothetical protein
MKHLKKVWVRILVSFLGGAFANELLFVTTGDITRSREHEGNGITGIAAIIIFVIITLIVEVLPQNK